MTGGNPIAKGWDEAAEGYEAYFVPRFAPWVSAAVAEVTAAAIPDGPILVPCCGTFPELEPLLARFPDREIAGIDLSAGMVARARARAAGRPRVTVARADAVALDPRWTGECAAVVSVFGLQQLPDPERALRSWLAALRPAGRLSVVYWPGTTEHTGPFALIREVAHQHLPAGDHSWEGRLVAALTESGATVVRDEVRSYPMVHQDAATFFDAYSRSGPMRALAIARGEALVGTLREAFLDRAPAGEWHHRPGARLLVARRSGEERG